MAGNRIKGITIEIGGDVTKLDKALQGTDIHLGKIQKSLKDVERQLKIDPGNTVLLEQKQRLLSEAMKETAERAKMLKDAASSANDALARHNDFQAKYAPLVQSLAEANSAYEKLKDQKAQMDRQFEMGEISTEQYDKWNAKMEMSRKAVADLEKQVRAAKKEIGGPMMDQAQFDALQREYIETQKTAEDAAKAAKKFNAEAASWSGVLSDVSGGAGRVADSFAPVSRGVFAIGAAVAATVPATEEFRADLSMLENNARMAGVGIEATRQAFERFVVASNEVDSSVEATSNLLQAGFTESNLQLAVENLAGAYLSFPDTLKIESLADSLQETIATGEATGQFAELLGRLGVDVEAFSTQMSALTDGYERQDFALTILSRTGLREAYESWVKNNEALTQNREATLQFQQSMANLAEDIQPFLTTLAEMASSFLDWFNSIPDGAKAAVAGIGVFLGVISPIAGIISAITGALSAAGVASTVFSIAGTSVSLTLGQWVIIIGVVIALVLALAAAIAFLTGRSKELKEMEMPEVPDYSGAVQTSGRSGYSAQTASAQDLPHLAQGTVTRPNSPFLAVVGDNPQEPEIIAPYSTIKRAAKDAMAEGGGSFGGARITVNFTGTMAQLVRMLQPEIKVETDRRGPEYVT